MLRDAALDGHTNVQYSIINFSEIKLHKDKRLDADHYHPWHLKNLGKIRTQSQPLSEFIIHISGGATPLGAEYPEEGIPFLRVQNIMPNYISDSDIKYLSPSQNQEILRSQLKKDDVLLTITGVSYGKSAVVTDEFIGANINQHSVKMTVRNIAPYFLSTFLNCKYGYSQSTRHVVGITRPALDYSAIKSFLIPDLDRKFQETIASYCSQAEVSRADSKQRYSEVQTLLLAELGLADWQPKQQLHFVKNFSDTQRAERIDADYFQPKYDEIVNAIKSYSGGWDTLRNQVGIKDTNFNPDAETEYTYIELANIGSNGKITDYMVEQGKNLSTRARRKVAAEDVIVSSIEGSLESIALITEEYDNALCSTGFYVIQSDVINSKVLLVLLKSIVGQLQLKKGCSGTILTAINKDEFSKIAVPKIKEEKQSEIEQKVDESFNLRKHAKDLLEHAKRAVEIAIEQDEQAAIDWLESVSEVADI